MRLHLIRHGETTANVTGALDTARPGADLTDLGREQAQQLVHRLHDEPIEALYTSTLVRTQQTARPLATARGLEITVDDGLREWDAGDLEMRTDQESEDRYLAVVFGWADGRTELRMPGGPDGVEALGRYDRAIAALAATGVACAAVISHGAAIRTWSAARARNADAAYAAEHRLPNTAVVTLDGDPERGWEVQAWGW